MAIRFRDNDMRIEEQFQKDLPEMYADQDALTQILINCLDNSRKFSEKGSKVVVKVEVQGSNMYFGIQDFGNGIPKKDLDKVFSRFYRVEDKDEERKEGSGLGLSIVKEFIKLHGGTITVESEPNKGTTLHILLPLKSPDEPEMVNNEQEKNTDN